MWRSEYMQLALYRGKHNVDLDKPEVEFMRQVRVFLSNMKIEFRPPRQGDAKTHFLNRFRILHSAYTTLKEKAESISKDELKIQVNQLSRILDFSSYRVHVPPTSLTQFLQSIQEQIDRQLHRTLHYDETIAQNLLRTQDEHERIQARRRQTDREDEEYRQELREIQEKYDTDRQYEEEVFTTLKEIETKLDETQRTLTTKREDLDSYASKLHPLFDTLKSTQAEIDRLISEMAPTQKDIEHLNAKLHKLFEQKTSKTRELSMIAFSIEHLEDEKKWIEEQMSGGEKAMPGFEPGKRG